MRFFYHTVDYYHMGAGARSSLSLPGSALTHHEAAAVDGEVLPVGGDEFVVDWFFNWFLSEPARFRFEVDGGGVTALDWGGRVLRREE